jgi:hypothetical protein
LAQDRESTEIFHDWEGLYRQLLRISEDQRHLVAEHAEDDRFAENFALLADEWKKRQEQIVNLETALRQTFGQERIRAHFEANIAPIIGKITENIRETAAGINRDMTNTGDSLRAFQEHRQLRRAYGDSDYGLSPSLYFDEKK